MMMPHTADLFSLHGMYGIFSSMTIAMIMTNCIKIILKVYKNYIKIQHSISSIVCLESIFEC